MLDLTNTHAVLGRIDRNLEAVRARVALERARSEALVANEPKGSPPGTLRRAWNVVTRRTRRRPTGREPLGPDAEASPRRSA